MTKRERPDPFNAGARKRAQVEKLLLEQAQHALEVVGYKEAIENSNIDPDLKKTLIENIQ